MSASTSAPSSEVANSLSPARKEHCFYCFDTLYARLTGSSEQSDAEIKAMVGDEEFPLFVTWNTIKPGYQPRLRGCIGNFEGMSLVEGLREYAIISALKDRRFSPIPLSYLPKLSVSVSLLYSFEPAADYLDWTLGTHGIRINLPDPATNPPPVDSARTSQTGTPAQGQGAGVVGVGRLKDRLMGVMAAGTGRERKERMLSATYLPDVAPEQGWSKPEAVDSCIQKAGWDGKVTDAIRGTIQLERYQSAIATASYEDWKQWRASTGRPV